MRLSILTLLLVVFSFNSFSLPTGEFVSSCFPHGEGLKNSFLSEVSLKEERFEGRFILFEGQDCKKKVLSVDYTAEANFPEGVLEGPLDKKVNKAYLIVLDEKWRLDLEKSGGCGASVIELYVPVEVQGLPNCGPFPVPSSGTFLFDFFKVENSEFSLGGYPLLWVTEEERRPALTSRIVYRPKVPNSN